MPVHSRLPFTVSDAPISSDVYNLPPSMQPQPALTRYWCWPCIKALTTTSNKYLPNGTMMSFAETMMGAEYCSRRGSLGVCRECRDHHVADCLEPPPEFRRAVNILDYLITLAAQEYQAMNEVAPGDFEEIMMSERVVEAWQQAFDYAKDLREAKTAFTTEQKRRIRDSGLTDAQYASARQVSGTMNLERTKLGLGITGQAREKNVVIDKFLETVFHAEGSARNCEKRWFYYGTDIPAADEVRPLRGTPSPTKSAFTTPARGVRRVVPSSPHTPSTEVRGPRGTPRGGSAVLSPLGRSPQPSQRQFGSTHTSIGQVFNPGSSQGPPVNEHGRVETSPSLSSMAPEDLDRMEEEL